VVDGVDLHDQIRTLTRTGKVAPGVPLLLGSVREDLALLDVDYRPQCEPWACAERDFVAWAHTIKKAAVPRLDIPKFADIYSRNEVALPGGNYSKWYWAQHHADADCSMICPARRTAGWLAASNPAYLYFFTHVPRGSSGTYPKLAHHASEIPFVFHVLEADGPNADEYYMHAPAEVALSATMARYWANFANTGDPNTASTLSRCDGHSSRTCPVTGRCSLGSRCKSCTI